MQPDHSIGLSNRSLPEVHSSVPTSHAQFWRRLFAFAGPAYLVSVGYMDPGNWATDLEGGSRFGYHLLWVLVMSNAMALLLQTLSARLGIIAQRDLAQACREQYPKPVAIALWVLCELAIIACDLAEVLGAAIGLNLLFGIPLLTGVFLTAADTLLFLWFTRFGIRMVEAFVLALIAIIGACFAVEIFWAKPAVGAVLDGLIPRLNADSLYVAVGMLGATVMPHNLYLHSALVQTRRIGTSAEEKRRACRYNLLDSALALNGAMFVNVAILVLAAAVFYQRSVVVTEIQQAHELLTPLLGTTMASVLFGTALLCAGQSSTLTGTMAGQIVMEGFLHFRIKPWLRRTITRMLAVIPAALTISYAGETGAYKLLILSQVILSIQLPFAIIPLVHFTSDKRRMGEFANSRLVKFFAWTISSIILALNIFLASQTVQDWLANSGSYRTLVLLLVVLLGGALLAILGIILFWPGRARKLAAQAPVAVDVAASRKSFLPTISYSKILVTLDHSDADHQAISNAVSLAKSHGAKLTLLHVEEDITSLLYGSLSSTAEVAEGQEYLDEIAAALRKQGIPTDVVVRHGKNPPKEIAKVAEEMKPDLIVIAAHGHRGLKDLIFGSTINSLRHRVTTPLLVVHTERKKSSGTKNNG